MPEPDSILALLAWDAATGTLTLDGGRYLLIRPETLVGVQWAAERAAGFDAARDLLVAGGNLGGSQAAATYRQSAVEVRPLAERMAARGTAIGWGRLTVESVEPGTVVFTATDSPFVDAYGGSERPVCHILTGALEGFGRSALSPDASAEEIECTAVGASACRFVVRAPAA